MSSLYVTALISYKRGCGETCDGRAITSNATCNTQYGTAEFNSVSVSQPGAGSTSYEYHNHKTIDSYGAGGEIMVGKIKKQEVKNNTGNIIKNNEYVYEKYHNASWYSDQNAAELTEKTEKIFGATSSETSTYQLPGIAGKHGSPVSTKIDKNGKVLQKVEVAAVDISTYRTYLEDIGVNPNGKNMVAQKALEVILENPNTDIFTNSKVFSTIDKQYIRSATVSTWACNHNPMQAWMPCSTFIWYSDMNQSGVPVKNYQAFNFDDPKSNTANWKYLGANKLYSNKGKVIESEKPINGKCVYTATVFGRTSNVETATLVNCRSQEGSVFTGDYRIGTTAGYWDYENGWEKGDDANVTLSNGAPAVHFGQNVIQVENDYAAGRNNRVYPGKAYVMTAWVKVTSGTLFMAAGYQCRTADNSNIWPIPGGTLNSAGLEPDKNSLSAVECASQWKLMKLLIPASKTSMMTDNSKEYYARAWVGKGNTEGVVAYIDDVRFYPQNAMVTSTYYDQKWQQPILSVDANNNPSIKTVYDDFGRVSEIYKVKKDDINNPVLLKKNKYHLYSELLEGDNVEILSPNGNEKFTPYQEITIEWVQRAEANANVICKKEGSASTYNIVNQLFPAGQNEY